LVSVFVGAGEVVFGSPAGFAEGRTGSVAADAAFSSAAFDVSVVMGGGVALEGADAVVDEDDVAGGASTRVSVSFICVGPPKIL
jgi:hypothetical protein